ncbi:hypothetical protein P8452_50845 [Trifolium repens]|nr:hypothetical protein P8452_50845 [Trifolium repens]
MLGIVVLPEESGTREQCIYKVPQKIRQVNPQAYTPRLISIGPFHSPLGSNSVDNHLQEMEELKLKYLKGFLNRTPNISVDQLFSKVQVWENKIRNCYAGCAYTNSWKENDPLLLKPWLRRDITYDLILLENQLWSDAFVLVARLLLRFVLKGCFLWIFWSVIFVYVPVH